LNSKGEVVNIDGRILYKKVEDAYIRPKKTLVKYDAELISKLAEWLGEEGISFFRDVVEKHGRVDAVFMDNHLPHPVHLREGRKVRNFLRKHVTWNAIQLDDMWVELVEKVLDRQGQKETTTEKDS
jgi:ribosomal protein L31E